MEVIGAIGFSAVLVYGGENVIAGTRTTGNFFAFLTSLYLCYAPFKGISRSNSILQQGASAANDLFNIIDTKPDPPEASSPKSLNSISSALVAMNVCFAYGDDLVIDELSLELPCGSTVALVGSSGGGKSTIIDLFCRFYDPSSGVITIDGIDISQLSLA